MVNSCRSALLWASLLLFGAGGACAQEPERAPRQEFDFFGRVFARDIGLPLEGVRVELYEGGGFTHEAEPFRVLLTDATGRYAFRGATPGGANWIELLVLADGFSPRATSMGYGIAISKREVHPFYLTRATARPGNVLLPGGQPAAGATVRVWLEFNDAGEYGGALDLMDRPLITKTDSEGCFRVWSRMPPKRMNASYPSWSDAWLDAQSHARSGNDSVILQLQEKLVAAALTGVVLAPDESPIEGATLRVKRHGRTIAATSDREGSFTLPGVPNRISLLEVSHPRYVSREINNVWLSDGAMKIRLAPGHWLRFDVADAAGNRIDLAGRGIACRLPADSYNMRRSIATTSTERGYVTQAMEPGAGTMEIRLQGYSPISVAWPEGSGEHDLGKLTVDRGTALELRVTDADGSPIPEARVSVSGDAAIEALAPYHSDAQGRWLCGGIRAGIELVKYHVSADGFEKREGEVALKPGATTMHTVALQRGATLRLTLVDADGDPAPWVLAKCRIVPNQGFDARKWGSRQVSDENGRLELIGIPAQCAIEVACERGMNELGSGTFEDFTSGEVREATLRLAVAAVR